MLAFNIFPCMWGFVVMIGVIKMTENGHPCLLPCAGTHEVPPTAAYIHQGLCVLDSEVPQPSLPTKPPPRLLMAAYQTVCHCGFMGFHR